MSARHVVQSQDGEACGVGKAIAGVERRRSSGAIAPTKDVCANHKKAVRVEGFSGTNEFLPPPRLGVGGVGVCVARGAESSVQ